MSGLLDVKVFFLNKFHLIHKILDRPCVSPAPYKARYKYEYTADKADNCTESSNILSILKVTFFGNKIVEFPVKVL